MTEALFQAMHKQARKMRLGMVNDLSELLDGEEMNLQITGLVFRPAAEEDVEEDEEGGGPEGSYVFEVHYHAEGHPVVNNCSTKLTIGFEDGVASYEEACSKFIERVGQ